MHVYSQFHNEFSTAFWASHPPYTASQQYMSKSTKGTFYLEKNFYKVGEYGN